MTDQADHPNSTALLNDLRSLRQEWTDLSAAHAAGLQHDGDPSYPTNDSVREARDSFERAASAALFELGCQEKATEGPREDDLAVIGLLAYHWQQRLDTCQEIARDQLERILTRTDIGIAEVSELITTVASVANIQQSLRQVMEAELLARPSRPKPTPPPMPRPSRQAMRNPAPRPPDTSLGIE